MTLSACSPSVIRPANAPLAHGSSIFTETAAAAAKGVGRIEGYARGVATGLKEEVPRSAHKASDAVRAKVLPAARSVGADLADVATHLTGAVTLVSMPVLALGAGLGTGLGHLAGRAASVGVTAGKASASVGATFVRTLAGGLGGTVGLAAAVCTLPTLLIPTLGSKLVPDAFRSAPAFGLKWGALGGHYLGLVVGGAVGGVVGGLAGTIAAIPGACTRGGRAAFGVGRIFGKLPEFDRRCQAVAERAAQVSAGLIGGCTGGSVGALVGVKHAFEIASEAARFQGEKCELAARRALEGES